MQTHSFHPKKKSAPLFLWILCLFFSSTVFAQKNAPVAGDAALLTELLKKDYSTLDPDVRRDALVKDRGIVIATFKRYLTVGQQERLKSNSNQLVSKDFLDYKKYQQGLTLSSDKFSKDTSWIKKLIDSSENSKQLYFGELYKFDIAQIDDLITVTQSENSYMNYIICLFKEKFLRLQNNLPDIYSQATQETSVQKALPFIGGDLGFEVVIDGLSKFLAERIKEELTVAVIEKVQDWLRNPSEDDPLAELKVLLPRTEEYLLNFKAGQMANFPDEIKQYIEDDLEHLLDHLGDLKSTPRIKRWIGQYPELDLAVEALELIPSLSKIKNPVDFFDVLENNPTISQWVNSTSSTAQFNVANTFKLSGLLAHSLTVVDNGELRMASADFLNAYGSEVNFYLLYIGFLYQQNLKYYNVEFKIQASGKTDLKTSLITVMTTETPESITSASEKYRFYSSHFLSIGENAEKIYTSSLMIKKARKNGIAIGADTLYNYVNDIINLTEEVTDFAELIKNQLLTDLSTPSISIKSYFSVARKTNEVVYDLQQEKYATAFIKALELTTNLLPDGLKEQPTYLLSSRSLFPYKKDSIEESWRRMLRKDWHTESWRIVLGRIDVSLAGTKSKGNEAEAKIVLEELRKINAYYAQKAPNFRSKGFDEKLNVMIKSVYAMAHNDTFPTDLNPAVDLLTNDDFKYLLISYYTKTQIWDFKTDLSSEVSKISYTKGGVSYPIFDPSVVAEIDKKFEAYVLSYYDYLLGSVNAMDEFKELKHQYASYRSYIESQLAIIPENYHFQLNEQTLKVIHFINDMAKSENSDDVKAAIEAFALPAGSYSIKRQERFSVALNSYPGILMSMETTWKNHTAYGAFAPSFTAPVGLNLGWGGRGGYSHSIYMSVLDVGAFTRMYLSNRVVAEKLPSDSASQITILPEFNFMNLFSPGIYYALGFKKSPLTFYAGIQYGPYLREVKYEENEIKTVNNYPSLRASVGLVLDIPLLNLHSRAHL